MLFLDILDKIRKALKGFIVIRKISIILHIVNIRPNSVKWNAKFFIALLDSLQLRNIFVAISALMPAKGPHWCKDWGANNGVIHLSNSIWAVSREEINITESSCSHSSDVDVMPIFL